MVVVFAHTGGLVGAEVGVAGGTAVLAQRILEAVFGDQAVRRLAETAKADLDSRVEALMSAELLRYHAILDSLQVDAQSADRLRAAAAAVERARADGLPASGDDPLTSEPEPALARADERLALEAPRVRQVHLDEALSGLSGDIVDAEVVEPEPVPRSGAHREDLR
jgi:hypothetical protein